MSELKPCPFCGAAAEAWKPTAKDSDKYDPSDRLFPVVRCVRCYGEAKGLDGDLTCESAIVAWNRHPLEDAKDTTIAALEARLAVKDDALRAARTMAIQLTGIVTAARGGKAKDIPEDHEAVLVKIRDALSGNGPDVPLGEVVAVTSVQLVEHEELPLGCPESSRAECTSIMLNDYSPEILEGDLIYVLRRREGE